MRKATEKTRIQLESVLFLRRRILRVFHEILWKIWLSHFRGRGAVIAGEGEIKIGCSSDERTSTKAALLISNEIRDWIIQEIIISKQKPNYDFPAGINWVHLAEKRGRTAAAIVTVVSGPSLTKQ